MKKITFLVCFFVFVLCAMPHSTINAEEQEESVWVEAIQEIKSTEEIYIQAFQNNNICKKLFVQKPNRRHNLDRITQKNPPMPKEIEQKDIVEPLPETPALKLLRSVPAQRVGLNFTAATVCNVQDPFVIPPNLSGWVGATQYILMSYNIIRSFNKATGNPDGVLDIDAASFFGVSANDVRIEYDRFSQRWFMSCEGINQSTGQVATLVLAVSNSGTISKTTLWSFYTFSNAQVIPQIRPLGSGDLDYQQLAIDQNAVYISVDSFDKNGNFVGSSVVVIKKSSIGTGNLVTKVFYGVLPSSAFITPADNFDSNPTFGYLINSLNNQYPSSTTYNKLYLYRISNPGNTNPSLGRVVAINVPSYTDPANAPYKGNLFGSAAFLQTSGSTTSACHIRKHQLYVCHNVQVNSAGTASISGNRVGVRWYQFDLTGDATGRGLGRETSSTIPKLIQWGTLCDNTSVSSPVFYYIPAIMTNKNGDLVIACTISGAQAYPNVAYAGRKASDPAGILRTAARLTNSSFSYNFGPFVNPSNANIGQRWGDLSSLCPDPVNDLDIWSTQEFAAVTNGWGIQTTKLIPA